MTEYRTYAELEGHTLNEYDRLHLLTEKFIVRSTYLSGDGCENDKIFKLLGLDKYKFCRECYGYDEKDGQCPECHSEDYQALTRLALAIFAKIEGRSSVCSKTTMAEKKIISVLVVNKKTGVTEKELNVVSDNEQNAILKAFGCDTENLFIKTTIQGIFTEEKPSECILKKE